jgi:hypothetical protein
VPRTDLVPHFAPKHRFIQYLGGKEIFKQRTAAIAVGKNDAGFLQKLPPDRQGW